MATAETHTSVRPDFPDDVTVKLRLRPNTLDMLRKGMPVLHVRLDEVAGDPSLFDIYAETQQEIDAVPAWHAPHSPDFRSGFPTS